MNCPVDGTVLRISERQGIEIDYCPQCRGIWLDRLLERAEGGEPAPRRMDQPPRRADYDAPRHPPRHGHGYDDRGYPRKKRKSLLGELLDF